MAKTINEVMTHDPITVEASTSIAQVARKMREGDTGAILVTEGDKLAGIVTDRDIVVRAIADGRDPEPPVGDIPTRDPRPATPDALTPLAWWGAQTRTIRLGTSIMQMSARTPAAAAMAAMTLDHLSGGRFILGLGVSGPQVVEGWYGQPFGKPLARTREYIAILRAIWARQGPVTFDGEHYTLPYPNGTGLGKPLKSSIHPLREDIPVFLGAEGPKNVALAAEVCAGWLA